MVGWWVGVGWGEMRSMAGAQQRVHCGDFADPTFPARGVCGFAAGENRCSSGHQITQKWACIGPQPPARSLPPEGQWAQGQWETSGMPAVAPSWRVRTSSSAGLHSRRRGRHRFPHPWGVL